ncbi:MAG TPA: TIGR03086 family metal-binding protein [Acidimicrobiales bacterium]|jgi:uncharacterized protein (TIGR03086 family)|nr:TIGR03086 family metal-binding protein [Acidimicrobiales bacterium]
MVDSIEALEQAWATGAALVADVGEEGLQIPSPCDGWDIRALLNHTLAEAEMMTLVNQGGVSTSEYGDLVGEAPELTAYWAQAGRDNMASWRESGLQGERTYFYGTFPAPASVVINLGEIVVHTWDLAGALGQDFTIDPDHAGLIYGLYSSFPLDGLRAGGQLGPAIDVGEDAPMADRMLGLLGRKPR